MRVFGANRDCLWKLITSSIFLRPPTIDLRDLFFLCGDFSSVLISSVSCAVTCICHPAPSSTTDPGHVEPPSCRFRASRDRRLPPLSSALVCNARSLMLIMFIIPMSIVLMHSVGSSFLSCCAYAVSRTTFAELECICGHQYLHLQN